MAYDTRETSLTIDASWASFALSWNALFKDYQEGEVIEVTDALRENWIHYLTHRYGTPKYSMLVLAYNKLLSRDELQVGASLVLPASEDLARTYRGAASEASV